MTTLYYRFKGASLGRPGGPWWHQEFKDTASQTLFIIDVLDFLAERVIEEDHDCPGASCAKQWPDSLAKSQFDERIWRKGCNYQSSGICNKCGKRHQETYGEAFPDEGA